jgi:5'-nucleotidase
MKTPKKGVRSRSRTSSPRKILVTNDDGIFSEGLRVLAESLGAVGEVIVVAPDREQSAISHALTIRRPLRATAIAPRRYAVDGTPTDCVNLALLHLLRSDPPDLVVSGINVGQNLGDDVTYSGTVSAAFEASLRGVPAIAVSQAVGPGMKFEFAASLARHLAALVLAGKRRKSPWILNVNLPATEPEGIVITRLGRRELTATVVEKIDPRGEKYYWVGQIAPGLVEPGTDFEALDRGMASITPLHLDLTSYAEIRELEKLAAPLGATVARHGRRPGAISSDKRRPTARRH